MSSADPDLVETKPASPRTWRLHSIVLSECSVSRGDGSARIPGSAKVSVEGSNEMVDDHVDYTVRAICELLDKDESLVAKIDAAFRCHYHFSGEPPSEAERETYGKSVALQATPFVREFLASTTMRMGLPPFYMSLSTDPAKETATKTPRKRSRVAKTATSTEDADVVP